jgi:hypothetical protein
MTAAEECRRHAEDADKRGLAASDPEVQETFRQIARLWRDMADQWERINPPSGR